MNSLRRLARGSCVFLLCTLLQWRQGCATDAKLVGHMRAESSRSLAIRSQQHSYQSTYNHSSGNSHQLSNFGLAGDDSSFDQGPDAKTPFRWSARTIAVAAAVSLCALLANAAGIGGGPFYVPAMNVGLGFDLKLCTGLSHTIVASGAIGSVAYGLIQPSPVNPATTLLNTDIALALIPAMLFGVSFGVLLNPLMPEWLQTALLGLLLIVVVRKTYAKGFKQWNTEKASKQSRYRDEEGVDGRESLLEGQPPPVRRWRRAISLSLDKSGVDEHFSSAHTEEVDDDHSLAHTAAQVAHTAEHWLVTTAKRISWLKLAGLLVLWAVFLGLQLQKAQHGNCTAPFGITFAIQGSILAAVAASFVYNECRIAAQDPSHIDSELGKLMTGFSEGSAADSDQLSPRNLIAIVGVVALSGFIAGLLGIGGALIFNPLLLAVGVHPQVVASTAVVIILFGSSSISLSFLFNGMLNVGYAKVFAPIAFVSSLIGVTIIGWAVRKSGRASIIILLMATVIAAGTVATVIFGGLRSYHEIRSGQGIGFKPFCQ